MQILPRSVTISRRPNPAVSESAAPKDIEVIRKALYNIMPSENITPEIVMRGVNGEKTKYNFEKFLDIDVLEVARKEKIPPLFFHLVIGEFKDVNKLSPKNRDYFEAAKKQMINLDGNIYAASAEDKNEALLDAAVRVMKRKKKFESKSGINRPIDYQALQRADKELRVRNRLEAFIKEIKKFFPHCKFSAQGRAILGVCDGDTVAVPKSIQLAELERNSGMTREISGNQIRWDMLPSFKFFAQASEAKTVMVSVTAKSALSPLLEVIEKLDPKAHIYKDGTYLKVESKNLKSPRLDDAFETVGKKCGAVWMGRSDDGVLVWQTKHDLEMKASTAKSATEIAACVYKCVAKVAGLKPTSVIGKSKMELDLDEIDEAEIVKSIENKLGIKLKAGTFSTVKSLIEEVTQACRAEFNSESAGKAKPRAKHETVKKSARVPRDVKPHLGVFYKIYVKPISYLIHLLQLKRKSSDEKTTIDSILKKLRKTEKKFMKENGIEVSLVDLLLKQRGLEAPKAA